MEWLDIINIEKKKKYYTDLMNFIDWEYKLKTIYPKKEDIFKALELTKFDDVKVVILGQDPYHQPNQAMGLAFSVPLGEKLPPSLKNIFKEIEDDTGRLMMSNGDLTYLAKQGVLLLNTILTVENSKPLSHQNKGWEIFTDELIKALDKDSKPKVFMLWGNESIKKEKLIKNVAHLVLTSNHPSPLSAYRGFFGNHHFTKANKFLVNNNRTAIEW